MDGNGRWAKQRRMPRVFGHKNGVTSVREVSEACAELGVEYLTLYAFSAENWGRPTLEVNALMALLVETVKNELATLNKNNIKLTAIGDLSKLPPKTYSTLMEGIEETKHNTRMTLNLALNYSARNEMLNATRKIAELVKNGELDINDISHDMIGEHLDTRSLPDPELLIRTSGEQRISNFLLWQIAYAELYFTDTFWPDFRREDFYAAIHNYQLRERRFGKISEQVSITT
jgi:undecaprenyl diphosphate synthase